MYENGIIKKVLHRQQNNFFLIFSRAYTKRPSEILGFPHEGKTRISPKQIMFNSLRDITVRTLLQSNILKSVRQ